MHARPPGSDIAEGAFVGNFVEVKNSTIGQNSKVNHLSWHRRTLDAIGTEAWS